MSEEIRKKIEEYIEEAYVGLNDDEKQAPFTVGDLKAETRDDIEFGYQLAIEEREKQLRMTPIVDVRSASAIPMQLCPKCKGTRINPYGTHNTAFPACDICNGAGIIPMAAGSKPTS